MLVTIRPAAAEDSRFAFSLQTPEARRYFINPDVPTWESHCNWFAKALSDPTIRLSVILCDGTPCGTLRLDELDGAYEVDVLIDAKFRGRGIATAAITNATSRITMPVRATIHMENVASLGLFKALGFVPTRNTPPFVVFSRAADMRG